MYKVIEHITKVNKRNKATTGVIILNPDEPAYFIPLATGISRTTKRSQYHTYIINSK